MGSSQGPEGKPGTTPVGVIILLSLALPGSGQLANDEKVKGFVFIGTALVLTVMFFAKLENFLHPLYSMYASGVLPEMGPDIWDDLKSVGFILLAGFGLFVVAAVDAVIVARSRS